MLLNKILLIIHIAAGFLALASALVAITNKLLSLKHQWHVYSGRVYFASMLTITVTAIPIALLTNNRFLLLIAVFSGYLVHAGWRYATNRKGTPRLIDWCSVSGMIVAAAVMVSVGAVELLADKQEGIILLVFGFIGWGNCARDFLILKSGGATGNKRIAMHLTMMLAGTIATVTAFVVTNFTLNPEFVLWLLPTVVITPLIVWWNRKLLGPRETSA